jgi:hypothetical protein
VSAVILKGSRVSGSLTGHSIVAVHGLNPTNKELHAESTWTAGDKLWLRDFLPLKIKQARVMLFGYNSNVAFEMSSAGVREQSENLLNRLRLKRKVMTDLWLIHHSSPTSS